MSDHDRNKDGGGLAVLIATVFLALLLLVGGGVAVFYFRRTEGERIAQQRAMRELAARAAMETTKARRAAAIAEMESADSVVENPGVPAPESPKSTQ